MRYTVRTPERWIFNNRISFATFPLPIADQTKRIRGLVTRFRTRCSQTRKTVLGRRRRVPFDSNTFKKVIDHAAARVHDEAFHLSFRPSVNATRINDVTDLSEIARVHSTGVKTLEIRL